jgi:hypothetical protein
MAKNAIAPHARADYEAQEEAWRKIAELLEVNEADRKRRPRRKTDHVTWWLRHLRSIVGGHPSKSWIHSWPRRQPARENREYNSSQRPSIMI